MRAAEQEAFDAFVRARYTELLRLGWALTGDRERAADLVQDALERTLRAWPRVRSQQDPEGYVRRTMVNRNLNLLPRLRREVLGEPADRPSPVSEFDVELWAALLSLPPRQRAVIAMRFYEDLPVAEIADRLGISEGTVKSQTAKAKDRLRAVLGSGVASEVSDGHAGR